MLRVAVQRHHVDVLQPDVDADSRLAVPEEVGELLPVGGVVGGLEFAGRVQVLEKHVRR